MKARARGVPLFAVLLILAILVEIVFARPLRPGARFGYYLGGMLAKVVAFTFWILDQQGAVCAPRGLLQGHAVWHRDQGNRKRWSYHADR